MSHSEAAKELKIAPDEIAVICITDNGATPDQEIVSNAYVLLHLEFADADFARAGTKIPTKEDVQKAIDFAKEHGDVWVCCHAGVSRSAAMAYVIECMQVHPAMAVNIWNKKRHSPNRMIVRLGGEILNNPNIEKYHTKWMNN